jgi:hypothetical protein
MAIVPVSTIASFHSMTKKDSLKAKEFMETIDDNFTELYGAAPDLTNFELELARKPTGDSFADVIYTGDLPTQYDYWADAAKTIKLFTVVITYTGTYPTTVVITDEVTGKVQTTTYSYTGDKVTGFNEEVV